MTVVDLYTIQLIGDTEDKRALEFMFDTEAMMAEAEENLTDLLPAGYSARIRRWDHPDPDPDEIECEHKWREYSYGWACRDCGTTMPEEGNPDE